MTTQLVGLSVLSDGLDFDLSDLHVPRMFERCRAALVDTLNRPQCGPTLARTIETLKIQSRGGAVRFFSNFREWRNDGDVRLTRQPAVVTWSDMAGVVSRTIPECRQNRTGVRVWIQDSPIAYGIFFEVLWHELLHPTVPFTHQQEIADIAQPPNVDDGQWYPAISALNRDMPQEVTDPSDGSRHRVWGEVWSRLDRCRCGGPALA